jgi:hypothetical protein
MKGLWWMEDTRCLIGVTKVNDFPSDWPISLSIVSLYGVGKPVSRCIDVVCESCRADPLLCSQEA